MSSIKQLRANRLNSQKSTGPRTLQGKAVSRFNALKTGIDAQSQIIPGEDAVEFATIAEEHRQRWDPALPEHRVLVDTLAHDEWQLRRLRRAEATHWRYRLEPDTFRLIPPSNEHWNGGGGNDFARLQRRMDSTERSFRLTLEKLECLAEQADPSGADLPACLPENVQPGQPDLPVCPIPIDNPPDEPKLLPNQPLNPGIGFVPSTPAAASRRPSPNLPRPAAVAVSTSVQPVASSGPPIRG